MRTRDVENRVRIIVARIFDVKPDEITRGTEFEELGADSLHQVELAMALEEAFDLEISEATVREFVSVQSILDHVHQHLDLK